jgi:hypothetical protein
VKIMSELNGSRARWNRNSKAMECAARYLLPFDDYKPYKEIFFAMTYKNGNRYSNGRNVLDHRQLLARMLRHPAFNHRSGGLLKLKSGAYEKYWSEDPSKSFTRRREGKQ